MKNRNKVLGFTAIIAVITLNALLLTGCPGPDDNEKDNPSPVVTPPQTGTYSGTTSDGSTFILIITESIARNAAKTGDSYVLYIVKNGETKTSNGTITKITENTLILTPIGETTTFTITVTSKTGETGITAISGTIIFDDGTKEPAPAAITSIETTPEILEMTRWWSWNDPTSTAKITNSVDKDGVCKIVISGTPVQEISRAMAGYVYSHERKSYAYTFEAWTVLGNRDLILDYYADNNIYLTGFIPITSTRKTYTVYGQDIPKKGGDLQSGGQLRFYGANQTGTFYIKILKIEEYTTGKLTITNVNSSSAGSVIGNYITGWGWSDNTKLLINLLYKDGDSFRTAGVEIRGDSVIIPVWETDDFDNISSIRPFHGNVTYSGNGDFGINLWSTKPNGGFNFPITFTNGNATIDLTGKTYTPEGE